MSRLNPPLGCARAASRASRNAECDGTSRHADDRSSSARARDAAGQQAPDYRSDPARAKRSSASCPLSCRGAGHSRCRDHVEEARRRGAYPEASTRRERLKPEVHKVRALMAPLPGRSRIALGDQPRGLFHCGIVLQAMCLEHELIAVDAVERGDRLLEQELRFFVALDQVSVVEGGRERTVSRVRCCGPRAQTRRAASQPAAGASPRRALRGESFPCGR